MAYLIYYPSTCQEGLVSEQRFKPETFGNQITSTNQLTAKFLDKF